MALSVRSRNLVLGVTILLLVDVIWVLSNELTKVTDAIIEISTKH